MKTILASCTWAVSGFCSGAIYETASSITKAGTNMSIEQIVAVVSAVIALISAVISVRTLKVQRYITKYAAAYTYLSTAEAMFRERPELLELHGLDLKVLEKIGVSPDEVLYLINSFTGADLYHRIEGTSPSILTTYRKALLNTPKVQQVGRKLSGGVLFLKEHSLKQLTGITNRRDY
jgi:hypothetical protein